MKNLGYFFYTLVLGLWAGGIFIFTFVMTPVIFSSFSRDLAGSIVGRLFPGYYLFTLVTALLSLVLLSAAYPVRAGTAFRASFVLVALAVLITLYTNISLHPKMQKVKQEVPSFETSSPEHPLRKEFRRLHAVSAVLNLALLADSVALLALATLPER